MSVRTGRAGLLWLGVCGTVLTGCQTGGQHDSSDGEQHMGNPTQVGAMERRRIDEAITDYLTRTKSWRPAEYRIEHKRLSDDGTEAIVWAVFLQGEINPVPGGGCGSSGDCSLRPGPQDAQGCKGTRISIG